MARQDRASRPQKTKVDQHQRQMRQYRMVFIILSVILILSMVLSLAINL